MEELNSGRVGDFREGNTRGRTSEHSCSVSVVVH